MRTSPEVSYIVSLYNRHDLLAACLWSLKGQTHTDFEAIITDNTEDAEEATRHREFVAGLKDKRFRYLRTAGKLRLSDCYWSAEYGLERSRGRWLCFPCDDSYYPPQWTQRMLAEAYKSQADLVLCGNVIVGPETCGVPHYVPLEIGTPRSPGYKPSFIIRREKFSGWISKPTVIATAGADRTTLQQLVTKTRWAKASDVWYVHN